MKVESYDFGEIVIDGKTYRSDVIILPDSVRSGWWRKEGHRLHLEDLDEAIEADPEVIIIGKGYHGRVDIPEKLVETLGKKGIELLSFDTRRAIESFNEMSRKRNVVAAFHLTC